MHRLLKQYICFFFHRSYWKVLMARETEMTTVHTRMCYICKWTFLDTPFEILFEGRE